MMRTSRGPERQGRAVGSAVCGGREGADRSGMRHLLGLRDPLHGVHDVRSHAGVQVLASGLAVGVSNDGHRRSVEVVQRVLIVPGVGVRALSGQGSEGLWDFEDVSFVVLAAQLNSEFEARRRRKRGLGRRACSCGMVGLGSRRHGGRSGPRALGCDRDEGDVCRLGSGRGVGDVVTRIATSLLPATLVAGPGGSVEDLAARLRGGFASLLSGYLR